MSENPLVIPAQAGIHFSHLFFVDVTSQTQVNALLSAVDSRLRGNDKGCTKIEKAFKAPSHLAKSEAVTPWRDLQSQMECL